MPKLSIFLDDGGVINDNNLRGPQWQRLVGEFFVPLLGGTHEAWSEANRAVAGRLLQPENWQKRVQKESADVASFRTYHIDWVRGMCDVVGIASPDDDACLDLAKRANAFITPRVQSAIPGAVEAIRSLHEQGYTLHTASSGPSEVLDGTLQGMGVRDCFGRLYGTDLINTLKGGIEYYEKIFADLNMGSISALFVDDSLSTLRLAAQLGARTILVSSSVTSDAMITRCIGSLAALPEALKEIEA